MYDFYNTHNLQYFRQIKLRCSYFAKSTSVVFRGVRNVKITRGPMQLCLDSGIRLNEISTQENILLRYPY